MAGRRKVIVSYHAIKRFRERSELKITASGAKCRLKLTRFVLHGSVFGQEFERRGQLTVMIVNQRQPEAKGLVFVCRLTGEHPLKIIIVTVLTLRQAVKEHRRMQGKQT